MACVIHHAPLPIVTVSMRLGIAVFFHFTVHQDETNTKSFFSLYSAYPYCGLLSFTEDGALTFFCTDETSLTFLAAYETLESLSTSRSTQSIQTTSSTVRSGISSRSTFASSSTNSITPSPVPFTQSQQTSGTTSQVQAATTSNSNSSGRLNVPDNSRNFMILAVALVLATLR
jgi:hypothetical protein